jgi:hypothetical protein
VNITAVLQSFYVLLRQIEDGDRIFEATSLHLDLISEHVSRERDSRLSKPLLKK